MCKYCHEKKWLKLTKYVYSQSKENTNDKHIFPDSMFITWWSLFQVMHPSFRCINTIQKVRRSVSGFVQVQRGRRNSTHLQNDYLYFKTNILSQRLTKNHKSILVRRMKCEWRHRENRWQFVNALRFLVVRTCFKSNFKLIKSIKMQTWIVWLMKNNTLAGVTAYGTISQRIQTSIIKINTHKQNGFI